MLRSRFECLFSMTLKPDPKASSTSKSGGATLLHYLAKTVEAKSAELLTFATGLGLLADAVAGPSVTQMESTLGDLRSGLGKLEGECDSCGNAAGGGDEAAFAAALTPFCASAAGEMARLNELAVGSEAQCPFHVPSMPLRAHLMALPCPSHAPSMPFTPSTTS